MLTIVPDEHPMAIQLFGAEPAVMAEAAAMAADAGADALDINMGCPGAEDLQDGRGRRPAGRARAGRGHHRRDGRGGIDPGDGQDAPRGDPGPESTRRGGPPLRGGRGGGHRLSSRGRRPRSTAAPPTTRSRPRWRSRSPSRSSQAATSARFPTRCASSTRPGAPAVTDRARRPRRPVDLPGARRRGPPAPERCRGRRRDRVLRRRRTGRPRRRAGRALHAQFYAWYLAGYEVEASERRCSDGRPSARLARSSGSGESPRSTTAAWAELETAPALI